MSRLRPRLPARLGNRAGSSGAGSTSGLLTNLRSGGQPTADFPHAELIAQLQAIHALKAGALRMFDPMLAAVRREREAGSLHEVDDLLEKMLGRFSSHREETADHAQRLHDRLLKLGSAPSRARLKAASAAAAGRARLGALGGQDYGANARDAYVYEHLEIASLRLLEQLAERCGDADTAALAGFCRQQDAAMVETIDGNWVNVTSLRLASRGMPVRRPPEGA